MNKGAVPPAHYCGVAALKIVAAALLTYAEPSVVKLWLDAATS